MKKRTGDTVAIEGDYQYRALTEGNPVQRFWHLSKQLTIDKYMPPASSDFVLDAGCGSGVISGFLGAYGASVLGIDGNREAIRFAASKFEKRNVHFMAGLVDDDLKIEKLVDKIYCLEVIEHIHYNQAMKMLRSFYNILKPGGRVLLTTPNYRSLWPLMEYFMDLLGRTPKLRGHQHIEFYNKKKLEELCREAGFGIEMITTTCLFSPWVALFSRDLALKTFARETGLPFCPGPILNCILVRGGPCDNG